MNVRAFPVSIAHKEAPGVVFRVVCFPVWSQDAEFICSSSKNEHCEWLILFDNHCVKSIFFVDNESVPKFLFLIGLNIFTIGESIEVSEPIRVL